MADRTAPIGHEGHKSQEDSRSLGRTLFSAFSFKPFRWYWTGAMVSSVGTWLQTTALLWFVKQRTGADGWVGLANMVSWIPILLLGVFSGAVVDRSDRNRTIIYTQAVMLASALAIAIYLNLGHSSLAVIMVLLSVSGVAYAFFVVAWTALIPDLVSPKALLDAVALNNAQFSLARFIGPALGGLVLLWSVPAAFYLNAATFLFFIVTVLLARVDTPPADTGGKGGVLIHVREGFAYVAENRWMLTLLASLGALAFFGFSFVILIPAVSIEVLHKGQEGYGLLLGMSGLGALVGLPMMMLLSKRVKQVTLMRASALAVALLLGCFALSRQYWLSCALALGIGAGFLVFNATVTAALQSRSRHDMQGRVVSLAVVMFVGMFPVGGLVMGVISDATSPRSALLLGSGVCLAVALALAVYPRLSDQLAVSAPQGAGASTRFA